MHMNNGVISAGQGEASGSMSEKSHAELLGHGRQSDFPTDAGPDFRASGRWDTAWRRIFCNSNMGVLDYRAPSGKRDGWKKPVFAGRVKDGLSLRNGGRRNRAVTESRPALDGRMEERQARPTSRRWRRAWTPCATRSRPAARRSSSRARPSRPAPWIIRRHNGFVGSTAGLLLSIAACLGRFVGLGPMEPPSGRRAPNWRS